MRSVSGHRTPSVAQIRRAAPVFDLPHSRAAGVRAGYSRRRARTMTLAAASLSADSGMRLPRPSTPRLALIAIYGPATLLALVHLATTRSQEVAALVALSASVTILMAAPVSIPGWTPPVLVAAGSALIAYSFTIGTPADEAVVYLWPALYAAYFFSGRMAIAQVVWIGVVHGVMLALADLPGAPVSRVLNVVVGVGVGVGLVAVLRRRVDTLVAALAHAATVDELTGVLNRRGFAERLATEIARARRTSTPLSLVMLDLDHFKQVNDTSGHSAGDRLLSVVGGALAAATRGSDAAARLGGEEFAVLAPDTPAPVGLELAERLRDGIASAARGAGLPVTASAGVSTWSGEGPLDPDGLMAEADRALYAAKDAGRDTSRAATP
jgi:diguanylate cyclase (GGDEF)-like protein